MALLGRLTAGQSRVYSAVQGAVGRGLGLNATQDLLQAAGIGIRREQINQLIHYFTGVTEAGYSVSQVRKDYFPNVDKFPDAITTLRRKYSFTVRLGRTGEFNELGQPVYNYVTVTSDKNMRVQDILDEAESYYEDSAENYPVESVELTITGAKKRG